MFALRTSLAKMHFLCREPRNSRRTNDAATTARPLLAESTQRSFTVLKTKMHPRLYTPARLFPGGYTTLETPPGRDQPEVRNAYPAIHTLGSRLGALRSVARGGPLTPAWADEKAPGMAAARARLCGPESTAARIEPPL
jgi:hypothetical protein